MLTIVSLSVKMWVCMCISLNYPFPLPPPQEYASQKDCYKVRQDKINLSDTSKKEKKMKRKCLKDSTLVKKKMPSVPTENDIWTHRWLSWLFSRICLDCMYSLWHICMHINLFQLPLVKRSDHFIFVNMHADYGLIPVCACIEVGYSETS